MSESPETQRLIGELKATVTILTAKVEKIEAKVDSVDRTLSEAKGGWRVLLLVGGAAGTVGAVMSWIVQHIPFRP